MNQNDKPNAIQHHIWIALSIPDRNVSAALFTSSWVAELFSLTVLALAKATFSSSILLYLISSSTPAINVSTSVILLAKFVLSTLTIGVLLIFGSTIICPGHFNSSKIALTVSFFIYATAVVGTLIHVKPVLHVTNEGELKPFQNVRGRKKALQSLVDSMKKEGAGYENKVAFIVHGDCIEDAEKLASIIKERFGNDRITISYVGPVIGAHSGPGTLALFFLGEHR